MITTRIDEGILIEIERRFSKLEEVVAKADLFLKSNQEDYEAAINKAEKSFEKHENYGRFCREANEHEADLNNVMGVREILEDFMTVCREDMMTMQEEIRRLKSK